MYAPISDKMSSYFNVSSLGIDMFSVIYMIVCTHAVISYHLVTLLIYYIMMLKLLFLYILFSDCKFVLDKSSSY